ncbi:MAG TPA: hypothetical protein VE135_19485 [Pyrinomonadaceae bacterium]|nr:hypothetical protein [Pyrinomonadaceae bacterium]
MMNQGEYDHRKKKIYKAILILLIGLTAISGVRKDLNELLTLANDVQHFADRWFGDVLPTVHARTLLPAETCLIKTTSAGAEDFHWTGRVAQGKSIEIKGISGDILMKHQPEARWLGFRNPIKLVNGRRK